VVVLYSAMNHQLRLVSVVPLHAEIVMVQIVWSSYKYSTSIAAQLWEFVLGKCAFIFNMC